MKLPNPNQGKPFDRITKDKNGEPEYGYRNERTNDEEIVHIPTNQSNQTYYSPEVVMNPSGCDHDFHLTSVGKREVECSKCHYGSSFIVGVSYKREKNDPYLLLKDTWYKISL